MTPEEFIQQFAEPRRSEIRRVHDLIRDAAPELEPAVAGKMIGYGPFHYRYATGREGDAHILSLASQKNYISLYVLCTKDGAYLAETYRNALPKADIGKSCVRIKRLEDIDQGKLRALIEEAAAIGGAGAVS